MESIGDILKNRRIEKGMDLAAAHEATKITRQNLAALEEDRFDAFPNRVYARAFLRDYANLLDIDSNELLERYETEWCAPPVVPKPVRRSWAFTLSIFFVFIVIASAGGLTYYYYSQESHQKPRVEKTNPKPIPPKQHVETPPIIEEKPPTPESTEPVVPTNGIKPPDNTADKPVVEPGTVRVELQAVGQAVWVWVKRNDKTEFKELLPADAKASFVGKVIWVRAGSAGALAVTVNGESVGRFGPPGKALNRLFKADQPPAPY